ncbi:unnamed protein product [Natator depressus]
MMSCGLLTSSKEPGTGAVRGRTGRGAELIPAAAGGGRGRRVQLLPGEFAPGEEAMLTLSYACKLPLEHDGADRYVLPTVLHPHYTPHGETHSSPCPHSAPCGVPGPGPPCGTGTWSCWCITRSHTNPARCWRPGCPEPSQAP